MGDDIETSRSTQLSPACIIAKSNMSLLKVFFFQKVRFVFQISKSPKNIIPKNYPELEI